MMQQRENEVPCANKGKASKPYEKQRRKRKGRANPHPAIEETLGHSYREEAEYDVGNAVHYLSQYRSLGIVALVKAARYVRMAIREHGESEKLLGNTLEPYIEEDEKK